MSLHALRLSSSAKSILADVLEMPREGLPIPRRPPDWDDATMDDIRMAYGVPPKASQHRRRRFTQRQDESGYTHNAHETLVDPSRPVPDFNVIVYDLGFQSDQLGTLRSMQQHEFFDQIRRFRFESYPSFFDIEENRGEYAWKPALIKEVWDEVKQIHSSVVKRNHIDSKPGKMPIYHETDKENDFSDVPIVLWMDTGDMVPPKFIQDIQRLVATNGGFYSPKSSGTLSQLTHPGLYPALSIEDPTQYEQTTNCNGALIAFSPAFEPIHKLMDDWWTCASKKSCIAPEGSNRMNHRQDQSALTVIAAREGFFCSRDPEDYGGRIHMDVYCTGIIRTYLDRWNEWKDANEFPSAGNLENSSLVDNDITQLSLEDLRNRLNTEYEQEKDEVSFRLWRWKVRADFRKALETAAREKARQGRTSA